MYCFAVTVEVREIAGVYYIYIVFLDIYPSALGIDPSAEANLGLNQVTTMCSVAQKLMERGKVDIVIIMLHIFTCIIMGQC